MPDALVLIKRGINALETRFTSLSLSQIFHISFLLLLASQLFLTVNFLKYGFEQNSEPSRNRLDQRVTAMRSALRSSHNTMLLINDPPSIAARRSLHLTLIDDPIYLNRLNVADWDDLPTCRRDFRAKGLDTLDVCVGVLAPKSRWGINFDQTGRFIYISVIVRDRPLNIIDPSGLIEKSDHIAIEFELGNQHDRIVVVNKVNKIANRIYVPTVYLSDNRYANLKQATRSHCQLRTPPTSTPKSIYLCLIAFNDLSITERLARQGWPPSAEVRDAFRTRILLSKVNAITGISMPIAATYERRKTKKIDIRGEAHTSIETLVRPQIDKEVEVCLISPDGFLLWKNGAQLCPARTGKFGQSAISSEKCKLWCVLSKALIGTRDSKVHTQQVDGAHSAMIWARYNEQRAGEVWIAQNAKRAFILVILMMATGLVYWIVFHLVLRPIQILSSNIEAASIDLTRRVIIPQSSPSTEIGILTRSFNALLARVTDVVDLEVNNLRMIGHDIRSPLQSLLAMSQSDDSYRQIKRIQNAIERFDQSRGSREAFDQTDIGTTREDLAIFLSSIVQNAKKYNTFEGLIYIGPQNGVMIDADVAFLEDVISHIIMNGDRYRLTGTEIVICLSVKDGRALIDIDNTGPLIPTNMLSSIFEYGVTTQTSDTQNLGQGLYAAKTFVTTMAGTIEAINLDLGVRFRITFPASGSE